MNRGIFRILMIIILGSLVLNNSISGNNEDNVTIPDQVNNDSNKMSNDVLNMKLNEYMVAAPIEIFSNDDFKLQHLKFN